MPKDKLLNGLANSLIDSYMSTLCYYEKGYMADWLYSGMKQLKLNEVTIDIMNEEINPKEMDINPLKFYLSKLKYTIEKTLLSNNFSKDYIKEANMIINLNTSFSNSLLCRAKVIDINNKVYKSKEVIIKSYEEKFSI